MKVNLYTVYFVGMDRHTLHAKNERDAIIIAIGRQLEAGKTTKTFSVDNEKTGKTWILHEESVTVNIPLAA